MSRKHYIEVAEMLKRQRDTALSGDFTAEQVLADTVLELALIMKHDNPRFDAGKFFEAAGFPELTGTRMGLN